MNQKITHGDAEALGFLAGGGEMGELIRAFDWSKTALGRVEEWPQSLRSAVSICLPSKAQIILCWGPELITIYNDGYRPVFGAKHPLALGLPVREAWRELWPQGLKEFFEGVLATGEAFWAKDLPFSVERFGYPEESFFDVSYDPVRDESGKVGGIFCIVNETTGRVVAARRLRTLRDLGTRIADAKSVVDVFRLANDVLADNPHDVPFVFAYAEGQALATGTPSADAWPLGEASGSGQPVIVERLDASLGMLSRGPWPEPVQSAVVLPIVRAGGGAPHAFLVAGVSPRHRIDADYLTFFDLVASQIASALANVLAYEQERLRAEALAEIDRAKTAFFSNISHEFRTPLTLMLGPLQDTLDLAHGVLPPEAADALDVVHRNSLRLLKLVNTMLDFARLEAGRVEANYETSDLTGLTAELASVFRSAIEKAGLRLIVDCPPMPEPAYVDRDMWEKVVLNLLSNAFKFTFEGEIGVQLRWRADHFELSIRDTGVGIPTAELPKIFQRFQRGKNSRARTHEGSGIGLAFVQELVKLHGGTVTVQSGEGVGTTFTVNIPTGHSHLSAERIGAGRLLAATSLGANPYIEEALRWLPNSDEEAVRTAWQSLDGTSPTLPTGTTDRSALRPRVLLADDNADMRDYLRRLMKPNYEVVAFADGQSALENIRAHPPDLVLTDAMMPRLDGFGLVAAIRADPRMRTLPVIMLSARAGEESRIEGLESGADDYVIKPFSARDLLARIASQLELARVRRESELALRHRGEQYETLLNRAPLGVYVVDADFRIREVNPVAVPLFGDIPGGVVGRDFEEILHILTDATDAAEVVRIFHHTLRTGEPYVAPERAQLRADRGVTEHYDWRVERITLPDGRHGLVCYFQNVSERVGARLLLERQAKELGEASRAKDEFLAMLGHELRNPLAPILTALEVMRPRSSEATEREISVIERQVDHLVRLVDDLMDVAGIARGKVELDRELIEMAEIVAKAIEVASPLLEQRKHLLEVQVPQSGLMVDGDPHRLSQVVSNLLTNAAKYTESGGRITLRACRENDEVVVRVADNGIGISHDMLPRVFDLFVQERQSLDRSHGGLGLGLTIVRSLVALHQGTVSAHSEGSGLGSEFTVRLPAASVPAPSIAGAPAALKTRSSRVSTPSGLRVLIVDDNEDAADMLVLALSSQGHEARAAYDGPAAIRICKEFNPAVALLDIGLPVMDGYELAGSLRRLNGMEFLQLIAVTGYGQESDRQRSSNAGFNQHFVKPIDLTTLQTVLAAWITNAGPEALAGEAPVDNP